MSGFVVEAGRTFLRALRVTRPLTCGFSGPTNRWWRPIVLNSRYVRARLALPCTCGNPTARCSSGTLLQFAGPEEDYGAERARQRRSHQERRALHEWSQVQHGRQSLLRQAPAHGSQGRVSNPPALSAHMKPRSKFVMACRRRSSPWHSAGEALVHPEMSAQTQQTATHQAHSMMAVSSAWSARFPADGSRSSSSCSRSACSAGTWPVPGWPCIGKQLKS